jgi:Aspartyl/Asparaginyl beta-hydroxylase
MTSQELLSGIRDANYHLGGIRCLRVYRLSAQLFTQLREEVLKLCAEERPSDARRREHITNWTQPYGEVLQFSLLNASGRCDDFSTDHDLSCFGKRFHNAQRYPALARFVEAMPQALNFRINLLGPNSGLSPHEEHTVILSRKGTVSIRARFHLPVLTNQDAKLILDGEVYGLEEATVYFVNNGCVHSAYNRGETERIHLVWDMLLTREAYELMFGRGGESALPWARVPEAEQQLTPERIEAVSSYRSLPPPVSLRKAGKIEFCEIQ